MTLIEQLKAKRDFSQGERVIADYILHHADQIAHMTISELAAASYSSKSAVVRLCRKVGLSGYRDLRVKLVTELERRRASLSNIDVDMPFTERESCATIMRSVAELQREALESCYGSVSPEAIDRLARTIAQAAHVITYAVGDTCLATQLFGSMLSKIGKPCIDAAVRADFIAATSTSGPSDLALFVSYSGRVFEMDAFQACLEMLRERGCKLALITAAEDVSDDERTFDQIITFPATERLIGAVGPFYSQECIRYVLNCVYARLYALDYAQSARAKTYIDELLDR